MKRLLFALAAAMLAVGSAAHAQNTTGNEFVTQTPGKLVTGVAIGCLDATGVWKPATAAGDCLGGTAPGSAQDVNISEIKGAAPSASNPLWVSPGTGATFPVSGGIGIVAGGNTAAVKAASAAPAAADPALVVTQRPEPGVVTVAGCTVGTASAQCLAANAATRWLQVQNTSASDQIACSWGGTAALNSSGSFMLAPGQSASWGPDTAGVPNNVLNCIASAASAPLYVERR